MPRFANQSRSGSESQARSAITRFSFCRGRPFARGTLTSASVASASVTSPGEALSSRTPSGRPPPSANTIHFVPLPRLVLPTAESLFRRGEAAVQKRLFPLQQAFAVERAQQRSPRIEPYILFFPLLQPPPAGRRRRIFIGQEPPRRSGLQHPKNPLQAGPIRRSGTASLVLAPLRLRQQRFDQLPLHITQ